jgi:prophage regulatory protein
MRHWKRSGAMRIIRRHQLTDKVGYCLGHIYRLERQGLFPRRIHLGRRAVGWIEEEIEAWLRERVDARDRRPER